MLTILFGSIKLPDLDAATLDNGLGLPCILSYWLYFFDEHHSLLVNSTQLVSGLLLSISLLFNTTLHLLIQINEFLIVLLNLSLNVFQRWLIVIVLIQELNNVEIWVQHWIIKQFLKLRSLHLFIPILHLIFNLHQIIEKGLLHFLKFTKLIWHFLSI